MSNAPDPRRPATLSRVREMGRRRPPGPRPADFTTPLRSTWLTVRLGRWLAVCVAVAFLTGLISHWAQDTDPLLPFPTRPVWGYRFTQGLHTAAGIAAVPLLLLKLWSVYPRLFTGLSGSGAPARRLVLTLLERGSIGVLVATSLVQVATGLMNTTHWYPWGFTFRPTHYALAWIMIGALVVHLGVKLPQIRGSWRRDEPPPGRDPEDAGLPDPGDGDARQVEAGTAATHPTRRAVVGAGLVSSAAAVLLTAGSAVPVLRDVSLFGVRSGRGPQGVPINKSAQAAGVTAAATAAAYTLLVRGPSGEVRLSSAELEAMEQHSAVLPIACVEGWSASGEWTGVRVRDLMELVGGRGAAVTVESLQESGPFIRTSLPGHFADDPLSLVALRLNGERLALDHGYPARLIAPNRPGVLQTKWLARMEVET
jgi:hypothetical protein